MEGQGIISHSSIRKVGMILFSSVKHNASQVAKLEISLRRSRFNRQALLQSTGS